MSVVIPDRKKGFFDATNFTALAGQVTTSDFKLVGFEYLESGKIWCENCNLGDFLSIYLVDVDNLLGYGAGAVLNEYLRKQWVIPNLLLEFRGEPNKLPIDGLFVRANYTSTGASDVEVFANIKGFKNI